MNGLPPISSCEVTNCYYNNNRACHAPAINVGDEHPACDTFVVRPDHIRRQDQGLVGACHVAECSYNADLTCSAKAIQVAGHAGHADCATFKKK